MPQDRRFAPDLLPYLQRLGARCGLENPDTVVEAAEDLFDQALRKILEGARIGIHDLARDDVEFASCAVFTTIMERQKQNLTPQPEILKRVHRLVDRPNILEQIAPGFSRTNAINNALVLFEYAVHGVRSDKQFCAFYANGGKLVISSPALDYAMRSVKPDAEVPVTDGYWTVKAETYAPDYPRIFSGVKRAWLPENDNS